MEYRTRADAMPRWLDAPRSAELRHRKGAVGGFITQLRCKNLVALLPPEGDVSGEWWEQRQGNEPVSQAHRDSAKPVMEGARHSAPSRFSFMG